MECASCRSGAKQHMRRQAALPRTFQFNRLLGIDTFSVRLYPNPAARGEAVQECHVLNIICHGSSYQTCVVLPRLSALEVRHAFLSSWLRPFGPPEAVLSDAGPEFHGEFEHLLERLNVLHLHTDPASPWQAGKVERHGGWLKELLEAELSRGRSSSIASPKDLDDLISELVAAKNRHLNRGGFSPAQLVFGRNPVIPHELLDQHAACKPEEQPLYPQDAPAEVEFERAAQVRRRARELAFTHQAKSKLNIAASARRHQDVQFRTGQCVYVWRQHSVSSSSNLQVRHRKGLWRGPGLVVLHSNHTVWVSMRSRLWRCNVDQVRNAAAEEMLGAELVQQGQLKDLVLHLHSTRGASAVDVASEGPPPPDESVAEQVHDVPLATGVPLAESSSQLLQVEVPQGQEAGRAGQGDALPDSSSAGRHTHSEPEPHLSSGARTPLDVQDLVPEEQEGPPHKMAKLARAGEESSELAREDLPHSPLADAMTPSADRGRSRSPRSQPAQSTQGQPWLRLTAEERRSKLQELERLPECLRGQASTEPMVESDDVAPAMESHFNQKFREQERKRAEAAGEVRLPDLSPEARAQFTGPNGADEAEWYGILKTNLEALVVHHGAAADAMRKQWPDRVIGSRMVRRLKPQPGVGTPPKAKSRFCVLGHQDPDTALLKVYAPTPAVEVMMIFWQLAASMRLDLTILDIKQAFVQGLPLRRERGPILVQPCEGVPLPSTSLVELKVALYGLDDAPYQWRQTLLAEFRALGFERSLLDA
eukprot:6474353-Amphidinium_carterae.1